MQGVTGCTNKVHHARCWVLTSPFWWRCTPHRKFDKLLLSFSVLEGGKKTCLLFWGWQVQGLLLYRRNYFWTEVESAVGALTPLLRTCLFPCSQAGHSLSLWVLILRAGLCPSVFVPLHFHTLQVQSFLWPCCPGVAGSWKQAEWKQCLRWTLAGGSRAIEKLLALKHLAGLPGEASCWTWDGQQTGIWVFTWRDCGRASCVGSRSWWDLLGKGHIVRLALGDILKTWTASATDSCLSSLSSDTLYCYCMELHRWEPSRFLCAFTVRCRFPKASF